jgi:hypothetical protein
VNDASRDRLPLDPRVVQIEDARSRAQPPSLAQEGFALVPHRSAVSDFRNAAEIARVQGRETERLLLELTGADQVVLGGPAVHRSLVRSADSDQLTHSGKIYNSHPAYFVHIDINDASAAAFEKRWRPRNLSRPIRRFAHFNLWRAISPPPQDLPLAVCDSQSVPAADLVEADAVMDIPGKPESSYVGLLVRYNPLHRWSYFPRMSRDEVLVFKAYDSDPGEPRHVPHVAFTDSTCPSGATPRASIEMRGIAYWFGE